MTNNNYTSKHIDDGAYSDRDPLEAEVLKIRSTLMSVLKPYIEESDLNQTDLAASLNTRRPVISAAVNNSVDICSIDILVKIIAAAGGSVSITASIPKHH